MEITNQHNLPSAIFDVLKGRDFNLTETSENIIWLTKLIGSPKCAVLERRHWGEIKEDISERVFRLMGTSLHEKIQQAQKGERLSEEKAYIDVEDMKVYTLGREQKLKTQAWYSEEKIFISLRLDCYDGTDEYCEDYKVTSVWGVIIEGKPKPDWIAQNSIAAWVLRRLGFTVKGQRNILFLRDWSQSKVGTDSKYPQIPIHIYKTTELWDDNKVETYIRDRVKAHVKAMAQKDDEVEACTPEERWSKEPKFAVMKNGRKTAVKLCDTKVEATGYIGAQKDLYLEERPGQDVKCESYCSVCDFCNYFKNRGK